MAFTFTERAAAELKDRIAERFREATGSSDGLADLYVGTIHAFCLELLQQHDFGALSYRVLTDVEQRLLISRNSRKTGLAELKTKNGKSWHRYHQAGTFAELVSILREADVDPRKLKGSKAADVLGMYEEVLERNRLLDYTSLLSRTVGLFETDPSFSKRVSERIRFVTVDEYQDVNPIQERLLAALSEMGADICVVGDDDQLIYDWRGSRMSNMIEFQDRYNNVTRLDLDRNFRSSRGIVDLSHSVIERNEERLEKQMISAENQAYEQGDIEVKAFESDEEEAAYIAAETTALLGTPFIDDKEAGGKARGLAFSDFAILVRVRSLIPKIVEALEQAEIPYVVGGIAGLFDTEEACAARNLFYYLNGEASEQELSDAWRGLDIGIDRKEIASGVDFAARTRADIVAGEERFGYYNLQRAYLGFLEQIALREEEIVGSGKHGHTRAEVIYYNLGKFSQVISDFEQIYFQSSPAEKYRSFAGFLRYQADGIYPEGWLEARYVMPNAVQVMTIHQAKGLQWPAVFVPGLAVGRFPAQRRGGISAWSVIPEGAVRNRADYETTTEDERRLFYVACTRAKKYLRIMRGVYPTSATRSWRKASPFWSEAQEAQEAIAKPEPKRRRAKLEPEPDREVIDVALSFSELKYAFECPYSFKLRFMYGFNPPIDEALGQGKGLHDCLFELHDRVLTGGDTTVAAVDELVDRHVHLPFAYPELREKLIQSAKKKVRAYIEDRGETFPEVEHAERPVEIEAGNRIRVAGRIDLIKRKDSDEVVVIDFKSNDRTQAEEVTDLQLHVYALGYQQAEGRSASSVVVTNLDDLEADRVLPVTENSLGEANDAVAQIGDFLRENDLQKQPRGRNAKGKRETCARCDLLALCRDPPK